MGKQKKTILVFIGLFLVYLLFWPVDADPAVWQAQTAPEMKGEFEPNDYLQDVEILGLNDGIGPEDIAVDEAGNMYAGYEDGRIIKYDVHGNSLDVFVNTKGRPLGMLSTMCCFQMITVFAVDVVPAGHAMFMLSPVTMIN